MSDRDALLELLKAREETVSIGGREFIVRELTTAADVVGLAQGEDRDMKVLVRSVFSGDGSQVFTDADIPALKGSSMMRIIPLIRAARRVNGLDPEDDAKKSEPQASDSPTA